MKRLLAAAMVLFSAPLFAADKSIPRAGEQHIGCGVGLAVGQQHENRRATIRRLRRQRPHLIRDI